MFQGLAVRFSIGTVIIIAIVFSIYGVLDYQAAANRLHKEQEERVNLLVSSLSGTISSALWNYELNTVNSALKASVAVKGIASMAISDNKGIVAAYESTAKGVRELSDLSLEDMINTPIYFDDGSKKNEVGILNIKTDNRHIIEELSLLIAFGLLKTLLTAVILVSTIIVLMRVLVSVPITQVAKALEDISQGEGDLTKRLPESGVGEIRGLAKHFNIFVSHIQNMVVDVSQSSHELCDAAATLKTIVDKSTKQADNQQQQAEHVATAVHEMSTVAEEVSSNAKQTMDSTTDVHGQAHTAMKVVKSTVSSVKNLALEFVDGTKSINSVQNSVNEISSVLDVIGGIAEQTNLLALNAAIEAARAGDQGRGFAVVADEVRALASRTQQSTGEIQNMIERLQKNASDAVSIMKIGSEASSNSVEVANEAVRSISAIVEHVSKIAEMNTYIANAVNEQKEVAHSINESIHVSSSLAQEGYAVSKDVLGMSNSVEVSSTRLGKLIQSFKA
jgi:methyl-accepting chemotaxis protein